MISVDASDQSDRATRPVGQTSGRAPGTFIKATTCRAGSPSQKWHQLAAWRRRIDQSDENKHGKSTKVVNGLFRHKVTNDGFTQEKVEQALP
jgi:hypothetical protein